MLVIFAHQDVQMSTLRLAKEEGLNQVKATPIRGRDLQ